MKGPNDEKATHTCTIVVDLQMYEFHIAWPPGAGPNGAIIHYRAEAATCGTVDAQTHLLIDSGGQYDCGTTVCVGCRLSARLHTQPA